jgi:O-antigen/teichoic acid export membrane protein
MWLSFYYVVAAGFAYVDVMVAAALLDESQVATLGAALRYLAIILAAIPALGAVLRVRTSQSDLVDSPSKQRAMVVRWFRRSTVPTALLVGGAILLAPIAIPVVDGGRYPDSIPVLQIFLVTAFSAYVLAPGPSMLMAQRQYVALAAIYGVGLTLNAVGDVAVAPVFGVVGIAVVSSLIYVAMDVVTVVWSLRYVSRAHA